MNGFDRPQLFAALTMLITALFITSGTSNWRYRVPLRWAAVACYALGVALVLIEIGRWLVGAGG